MNDSYDFAPAIAACFDYDHTLDRQALEAAIRHLFKEDRAIPQSKADFRQLDERLNALTLGRKIALVYGGATKIKGYVFEAPKLPEIRGASALLDWVNEVKLPELWGAYSTGQFVEKGIIYASGGNILAFASVHEGQTLATAIEHAYTGNTLTANSVAVWDVFSLLELRYGRDPLAYWVEDFLDDWKDERKRRALEQYYYLPQDRSAGTPDALQQRFQQRKTFGELVTVLATKFNRRRDQHAYAGEPRSVPLYQMLPWAEKCDSSDVRPAVVNARVGEDQRELSEASGRKLIVGRAIKGDEYRVGDLEQALNWRSPPIKSWEYEWKKFLREDERGKLTAYAQAQSALLAHAAQDVGEIAQASVPGRYIGVIYADGNNVGRLIATLKTPEAYARTSSTLREAAKGAVFAALAEHLTPADVRSDNGEQPWVHPFEILAIGGDDLFLIVPGSKAFDVARAIGQHFEKKLAENEYLARLAQDQRLSTKDVLGRYGVDTCLSTADYKPIIGLSAGVIVAQANTPIFFLRDLVEELLKKAKKLAKHNTKAHYYGGAVDFMVMKSITMVTNNIEAFRQAALGDGSARRLTARPYTWHEFDGLLRTARELKKARMPRSQLYRLWRALDADQGAGVVSSVMEYLYTRSRLRANVADALLQHIERNWCHAPAFANGRKGLPPWMPIGHDSWETIWPDLLEVYEMVPEQEE